MTRANFNKTRLKVIALLAIALNLCLLTGCGNASERSRSQVEVALGIQLPKDVLEAQYEKVFESSELTKPYYIFVQIEISEEGYLGLVQQLGLTLQLEAHKPSLAMQWLRPDSYSPDWWHPPDTNGDLFPESEFLPATGEFKVAQNGGWVVSAYHNGVTYIRAHEEGIP